MIDVQDIVFNYNDKCALDHVSCTIRQGSVTALVGPNGAGKTTLIRCLVGLYEPMRGQVLFQGQDVHRNARAAHRRMGYLTDFFGVYDKLTARRCLTFAARAFAIPETEVAESVLRAARRLQIESYLETKAEDLSRGLRQRLAIAQTLIHEPAFVVLDEPASGLDPEARRELSGLLLGLSGDGMTILVSSHILAELEDYCSDMLVMRDGRIVDQRTLGTPAAPGAIRLRLDLVAPDETLAQRLAAIEGVSALSLEGSAAWFDFTGDARAQHRLLRQLVEEDLPVIGLREEQARLQDSYFASLVESGGEAA